MLRFRRQGVARSELGLAVLRIVVAAVFIAHGAPKLLGGVGGLAATLDGLGFPAPFAWAWFVTGLESLGGLLLLVGLLVTPVALLLCAEMAAGIALVHAPNGWYVVGPGTGGVEFNLLLIASLLTLILAGPGLAAADRWRGRKARGATAGKGEPATAAGPPAEIHGPDGVSGSGPR